MCVCDTTLNVIIFWPAEELHWDVLGRVWSSGHNGYREDGRPIAWRSYFSSTSFTHGHASTAMARACSRWRPYFPFSFLSAASFSLAGLSLREASAISRASSSSST